MNTLNLSPDEIQLVDRVANGARYMDEYDPQWFTKIDTEALNMSSPVNCIWGQLTGWFQNSPFHLEPGRHGEFNELGFSIEVDPWDDEPNPLTELRRQEIAKRMAARRFLGLELAHV